MATMVSHCVIEDRKNVSTLEIKFVERQVTGQLVRGSESSRSPYSCSVDYVCIESALSQDNRQETSQERKSKRNEDNNPTGTSREYI